jgi:hypothetical protein
MNRGTAGRELVCVCAEAFRQGGYDTTAFVSGWVLDPSFSWVHGFDVHNADFPKDGANLAKQRANPDAGWLGKSIAELPRPNVWTVRAAP